MASFFLKKGRVFHAVLPTSLFVTEKRRSKWIQAVLVSIRVFAGGLKLKKSSLQSRVPAWCLRCALS